MHAPFTSFTDADARPYSGQHRCTVTIPTPPPVTAFWSMTMYDNERVLLVDNEIHR